MSENLLENIDGVGAPHQCTSIYADGRSSDDVIALRRYVYGNADLMLPAAAANGLLAAAVYAVLDLMAGGPHKLLDNFWHVKIRKGLGSNHFRFGPTVGMFIGGVVGVVAPYVYLQFAELIWDVKFPTGLDVYLNSIIGELMFISVPTGVVAGGIIHVLIEPIVTGIGGLHWTKFAAPILGSTLLLCIGVFRTRDPVPSETSGTNSDGLALRDDGGKLIDYRIASELELEPESVYANQLLGFYRESAREHGRGFGAPHQCSLGAAACYFSIYADGRSSDDVIAF